MLDLGANVECDAENLVQFALMGDVFARPARPVAADRRPAERRLRGAQGQRGGAQRRRAAARRHDADRFHGFVEGNDITSGMVDVVVTDGFTGNVALKAIEGTAKLFSEFAARRFPLFASASIGYLFAARRA